MGAKTEEWLYRLLWITEVLQRPTFRNLTESFEGWASRRGLLRQLHLLEKKQLLERPGQDSLERRVYRLTEAGRVTALGGRDPQTCWNRRWDGQWRMVIFDLPETQSSLRVRLRRFLRARHFGYLQNSVWITPDPLEGFAAQLREFGEDVESLVLLEARPFGGAPNSSVVQGAWEFDRINRLYREYLEILEQMAKPRDMAAITPERVEKWFRNERAHWFEVMTLDPLLPENLLPPDYLGQRAWEVRERACKALAARLVES